MTCILHERKKKRFHWFSEQLLYTTIICRWLWPPFSCPFFPPPPSMSPSFSLAWQAPDGVPSCYLLRWRVWSSIVSRVTWGTFTSLMMDMPMMMMVNPKSRLIHSRLREWVLICFVGTSTCQSHWGQHRHASRHTTTTTNTIRRSIIDSRRDTRDGSSDFIRSKCWKALLLLLLVVCINWSAASQMSWCLWGHLL